MISYRLSGSKNPRSPEFLARYARKLETYAAKNATPSVKALAACVEEELLQPSSTYMDQIRMVEEFLLRFTAS